MSQVKPYQPALLRLLHGGVALLVCGALGSGFLVYNAYDQRWGGLKLPLMTGLQDIHGTIGVMLFCLWPLFAVYSLRRGNQRLVQHDTLSQLGQVPQAIGWVAWQRGVNTLMLLAGTCALLTGRMMQEAWLPNGAVNQPWYLAHLASWLGLGLMLGLHGLMSAKVGGWPLIQSMWQWTVRSSDRPDRWLKGWQGRWGNRVLLGVEVLVFGGLGLALVLPLVLSLVKGEG